MFTCYFRVVFLNLILVNICTLNSLALPVPDDSSVSLSQFDTIDPPPLGNISLTNLTNLTPHDSSFRDVIKTAQFIANSSTGKIRFFRVTDVLSVISGSREQNQQKVYRVIMKLHETPCAKKCGDYTKCDLKQNGTRIQCNVQFTLDFNLEPTIIDSTKCIDL